MATSQAQAIFTALKGNQYGTALQQLRTLLLKQTWQALQLLHCAIVPQKP